MSVQVTVHQPPVESAQQYTTHLSTFNNLEDRYVRFDVVVVLRGLRFEYRCPPAVHLRSKNAATKEIGNNDDEEKSGHVLECF